VSVAANIAEGCGRHPQAEKAHFLQIAVGSTSELECYLLVARDLGLLEQPSFERLAEEVVAVRRMLGGLLRKVRGGSGNRRRKRVQKDVGGQVTPAANRELTTEN
jgi:four helix bundle protein